MHSKVQEDQQAHVPPPVETQEEVQASVPKAEQTGVQVDVQPQDAATVKSRRKTSRKRQWRRRSFLGLARGRVDWEKGDFYVREEKL